MTVQPTLADVQAFNAMHDRYPTVELPRVTREFVLAGEGKCGRCARRLTTPESVQLGFGPECAKLLGY